MFKAGVRVNCVSKSVRCPISTNSLTHRTQFGLRRGVVVAAAPVAILAEEDDSFEVSSVDDNALGTRCLKTLAWWTLSVKQQPPHRCLDSQRLDK